MIFKKRHCTMKNTNGLIFYSNRFVILLAILLSVLKLDGTINLSWIWIASPMFIDYVLGGLLQIIQYCLTNRRR